PSPASAYRQDLSAGIGVELIGPQYLCRSTGLPLRTSLEDRRPTSIFFVFSSHFPCWQGDTMLDNTAVGCYISTSNGLIGRGASAMDNRDLGKRFDEVFQKMDRAYERYARSCGMTYSSLALLQLIWERQPCTQKELCALT